MAPQRFYNYYLEWPGWLTALPDAALHAEPAFSLRFAWVLLLTGHIEAAERPFGLAETRWSGIDDRPKLGEVLGMRSISSYFKGHLSQALLQAHQALALLPADAIEPRGIPTFILGMSALFRGHVRTGQEALVSARLAFQDSDEVFRLRATSFGLAYAYQLQGWLHQASALYQELSRSAGNATYLQVPAGLIYLGMVLYEWNDLAAAEKTLREGIIAGQRTGRGRYWPAAAYSVLARVCWARGEATEAMSLAEHALTVARQLDNPREIANAHAHQAWLWQAQGNLAALEQWLASRAIGLPDEGNYERQAEYLMLARIRIAQAQQAPGSTDLGAVTQLLKQLRQRAQADQREPDQITILALLALAQSQQRQPSQALESLMAALVLAEPEGYIRTFVDEGAAMRSLLVALRAHISAGDTNKRLVAYADKLLESFPQPDAASPAPALDLLSERERTVLQLIAAGRSIQEIATSLVISPHTVRTHLKNIYTKLGAHNRVQALQHAHALHMI